MHRQYIVASVAIALGLAPACAHACERDPFLFQLPGESETIAAKRSEQISADYRVQEHFERESQDFKTAKVIYLARVVSRSAPGPRGVGPSAVVHPIAAFRGTLPSTDQTLQDTGATGMCTDIGDGRGAWGAVGGLIVIFESLPEGLKNAYGFNARPRGKDSFDVSEIRTVELLDWLRDQGKDLER